MISELELKKTLEKIKIIFFDVDGVFTNGSLMYIQNASPGLQFNSKDGLGIQMLMSIGVKVVIVTGRTSEEVSKRFSDLGVSNVYQGIHNKYKFILRYLRDNKIKSLEVAYMGDDLQDFVVFKLVGFSCAPSDSVQAVLNGVNLITDAGGGNGAVRQFCDLVVESKGFSHLTVYLNMLNQNEK